MKDPTPDDLAATILRMVIEAPPIWQHVFYPEGMDETITADWPESWDGTFHTHRRLRLDTLPPDYVVDGPLHDMTQVHPEFFKLLQEHGRTAWDSYAQVVAMLEPDTSTSRPDDR